MKRVVVFISLLFSCFLCVGVPEIVQADASHWRGATHIEETGQNHNDKESFLPIDCQLKNTNKTTFDIRRSDVVMDLFANRSFESAGEFCHMQNGNGVFALQYTDNWNAPRYETRYYAKATNFNELLIGAGTTSWFDPAPYGNNLALLYRPDGYTSYYDIRIEKNLQAWTKEKIDQYSQKLAVNSDTYSQRNSTQLTYADGQKVQAQKHVFSRNGRYLLWGDSQHIGLVDVATMRYTPVVGNQAEPVRLGNFTVSNDGKYIATVNSGNVLTVFDTSSCETTYDRGDWIKSGHQASQAYPGCEIVWQNSKTSDANSFWHGLRQTRRVYFSQNGDSIHFSRGTWLPESGVNKPKYNWQEFKLVADEYVSGTQGYLAMGDSYSSGEGDNHGGDWYEPGTDEQGDEDTFFRRNLCHLSRRSYPYLIALELGYLNKNTESPPTDGLFHSVACSGAEVHNVGGVIGDKQDAGQGYEFRETDNQYRYNRDVGLGEWQPGFTKQISAYTGEALVSDSPRMFQPEVITLGIGGNDAGFGDFLRACVLPGTCEHAKPNSEKATRQAQMIASQKPRLASLYKKIKNNNPNARIYVHGYPVFIRGEGGRCGANVHLDDSERKMAEGSIRYMNEIVQAAAREAGVFYIDISNILTGGRLCDESTELYVNGATAGNDNINIFVRNIIGNESFHPNSRGFIKYKSAIIAATSGFEAEMPNPEAGVDTPPPSTPIFGQNAVPSAEDTNVNYSVHELISQGEESNNYIIEQAGLYPGSEVLVEVHSTPQILARGVVDAYGAFSTQIELPYLEPGHHEIHLFGYDMFGQQIDWFQSIFIGQDSEDFDGDGILNSNDSCKLLPNSDQDADDDGIDDSCDGMIEQSTAAASDSTSTHSAKFTDSEQANSNLASSASSSVNQPTAVTQNYPYHEPDGIQLDKLTETSTTGLVQAAKTSENGSKQVVGNNKSRTWLFIILLVLTSSIPIVVYTKNRRKL